MGRSMANYYVSVALPDAVIQKYIDLDDDTNLMGVLRDILENALPKYFDEAGKFKGIQIGFSVPLCIAQGRQPKTQFTQQVLYIRGETWELLNEAKKFTTMSCKKLAEVMILKELLEGGESQNAEDCSLYS